MKREITQGVRRVIVAGGGTGGHLFPGLAVAEELRRRLGQVELLFVGTRKGIEARVLPEKGERVEFLEVTPLKGRGPVDLLRSVARLPTALSAARGIVRDFAPDLVVGVGGYAAGPVVAAAKTLGIPTAILEQNAHVGLTNRWLSKVVDRAYVSFEETLERFGAGARLLGNPVRADLVALAHRASTDPEGFEARANTVLILGGSQGASALNEAVPAALALLKSRHPDLRIVHQCGRAGEEDVRAAYASHGLKADVRPFIDDMASAYGSAALVIARAGATTLAELSALGRPSILVPYPFAAEDHQTKNARALESAGAAICLPQDQLSSERLAAAVDSVLGDVSARGLMAEAARGLGRPDAAAAIVDDVCEWLGWTPPPSSQTPTNTPKSGVRVLSAAEDDDEHDMEFRRPRLRGYGSYSPVLRRASRPRPARRALVFEETLAWE